MPASNFDHVLLRSDGTMHVGGPITPTPALAGMAAPASRPLVVAFLLHQDGKVVSGGVTESESESEWHAFTSEPSGLKLGPAFAIGLGAVLAGGTGAPIAETFTWTQDVVIEQE